MLSCVQVAALRRADHSSMESYRLCKKYYESDEEARAQQRPVESLMNEWMNEWTHLSKFDNNDYVLSVLVSSFGRQKGT
jgi:hypothetical protein